MHDDDKNSLLYDIFCLINLIKQNLSYSYIAMSTLKHILKKKEVAKGFISNFYRILEKKLLGPFLFKIKFKNKS